MRPMKALRVGDKVKIITKSNIFCQYGKIDIVQEAQYNESQDWMEYSLVHGGAWFSNADLKFISSDGLRSLRRELAKERLCNGDER